MGKDSKIEWCDHTLNPWWGCTKCDACCVNCYAATFSRRQGQDFWGENKPRRIFGEKHWRQPINWNKAAEQRGERHKVFCGSMCDVLEIPTSDEMAGILAGEREKLWGLIEATPHLDWLLLTKRPENFWLLPWDKMPSNVFPGVTVGHQDGIWRVEEMLALTDDASVHFVSAEPLIESVDFGDYMKSLQWIIVGGESGRNARPMHPDWARAIRDQAAMHDDLAFFFKQWGEWAPREPGPARRRPIVYLDPDGTQHHAPTGVRGQVEMIRLGKQRAGNLLDGKLHQVFPIPRGDSDDRRTD